MFSYFLLFCLLVKAIDNRVVADDRVQSLDFDPSAVEDHYNYIRLERSTSPRKTADAESLEKQSTKSNEQVQLPIGTATKKPKLEEEDEQDGIGDRHSFTGGSNCPAGFVKRGGFCFKETADY